MKRLIQGLGKTSVLGLAAVMVSMISAPMVSNAASSSMMGSKDMMMNHSNWQEHRQEMMKQRSQMMKWRQDLRAKVQQQDAALAKLVKQMNNASGQEKSDLMAKVLTKLVHDRVALNKEMSQMPFGRVANANRPMMHARQGYAGR